MPSANHDVRLTPGELPKSNHQRLLVLLFGSAAAATDSPAARPSVGWQWATGASPTRADAGASQEVLPTEAWASVTPTRPGSANPEAVA